MQFFQRMLCLQRNHSGKIVLRIASQWCRCWLYKIHVPTEDKCSHEHHLTRHKLCRQAVQYPDIRPKVEKFSCSHRRIDHRLFLYPDELGQTCSPRCLHFDITSLVKPIEKEIAYGPFKRFSFFDEA